MRRRTVCKADADTSTTVRSEKPRRRSWSTSVEAPPPTSIAGVSADGETIDQLERHDCLSGWYQLTPAGPRAHTRHPSADGRRPPALAPAILARTAPDPPCRLGIFSATVISFTIGGWTDARACGDLRSQWLVRPFTRSGPNRKGRWSACVAAIGREPGC